MLRRLGVVVWCLALYAGNSHADSKRGPMVPFKAKQAFLAHAAKVLNVSPDQVDGGANEEATARGGTMSVGGAWQYVMWIKPTPGQHETRGWATADGTVITPGQNLGVLFVEAGVWAQPMPKSEDDLADRLATVIAWSYATNSAGSPLVFTELRNGMAPPVLTLREGVGALRFFTRGHPVGPGGAGGGPETYYEYNVALTADHKATLTKVLFTPTP